jgi:hypothetical protein
MRVGAIISLIVVGGAIVVAPVVAEYRLKSEHQASVARMLEKGSSSVSLMEEDLSTPLRLGCWFTGTVMAVAGVLLMVREQRAASPARIDPLKSSLATDDPPLRSEPGASGAGIRRRPGP